MEKNNEKRGENSNIYPQHPKVTITTPTKPTYQARKEPTHTPEEIEMIKEHIENYNPDPLKSISRACQAVRGFIVAGSHPGKTYFVTVH